jgi:hypothetical protein
MGSLNKLNKLKTGVINKLADKVANSGNSEGAERIRAADTRNQKQASSVKAKNPTSNAGQNSGVGRLSQATSPINTTLGKKIKAL